MICIGFLARLLEGVRSLTAIVLAAGKGERLGLNTPKQFIKINGKEMVKIAVERMFKLNPRIIILTTPKDYVERTRKLFEGVNSIKIIEGGKTRAESVLKALELVNEDDEVVLIHDGARPFFPVDKTLRCVRAAEEIGAATLAVPVKDTIAISSDNKIASFPDRSKLWALQTPQCFKAALIKKAHELLKKDNFLPTDDTSLILRYNLSEVKIVEGEHYNIKVTYPVDLAFASVIMEELVNE